MNFKLSTELKAIIAVIIATVYSTPSAAAVVDYSLYATFKSNGEDSGRLFGRFSYDVEAKDLTVSRSPFPEIFPDTDSDKSLGKFNLLQWDITAKFEAFAPGEGLGFRLPDDEFNFSSDIGTNPSGTITLNNEFPKLDTVSEMKLSFSGSDSGSSGTLNVLFEIPSPAGNPNQLKIRPKRVEESVFKEGSLIISQQPVSTCGVSGCAHVFDYDVVDANVSVVPLPSAFLNLSFALAAFGFCFRKLSITRV